MAGTATKKGADFKPAWLSEATRELGCYTTPFTSEFMKKHGLKVPPAKTRKAMLARIRRKINSPKARLKFEDLVEYLDELRLWGRQYVIFYALKYDERRYLKKLINPAYIKERLGNNKKRLGVNLEDRYNNNICQWESEKPFLSEVKRNFDYKNNRGELSFKWVQTRRFRRLVGTKIRIERTFRERSVNFFIVNLADGSAQLRIQTLPDKSLTTLEEQIHTYKKEIGKLLNFRHFSPVPLEPVMREFLLKEILPIAFWRVETSEGRLQGDIKSPSFIQRRLNLPFQNITPLEIRVFWEYQQEANKEKRLYFSLVSLKTKNKKPEGKQTENKKAEDKKPHAVLFNAITEKSKEEDVLSKLFKLGKLRSKDKYIKKPIVASVIIKSSPPPTIGEVGVVGVAEQNAEGTPHEQLTKVVVRTAIVPSSAVSVTIIELIRLWLQSTLFEGLTHIPFIIIEVGVCGFLLSVFYGNKRVKNLFLRIPPKYLNMVISLILGKSPDIEFGDKTFKEQQPAEAT